MTKRNFTTNKVDQVMKELTSDGTERDDKLEFRFSARFTKEQWAYIQEYRWQNRITNMTQVFQSIVEENMKQHPEIVAKIDEINGK